MKVLFFPQGDRDTPSSRVRVFQYIDYLERCGVKCRVYPDEIIKHKYEKWTKLFVNIVWSDIVFVQKKFLSKKVIWLTKVLRKKKIFDFDDAIYVNQFPGHSSKEGKFYQKLVNMVKGSDTVIVGNNYLKDFAIQYNKSCFILPSVVDTDLYPQKRYRDSDQVIIGWVGTPNNLVYVKKLESIFNQLKKKYDEKIEFRIICSKPLIFKELEVEFVPWKLQKEVKDLSIFDIGIMPLPENAWTRGKCGYKALLYMALGIAVVCSPVGINKEIVSDGENGFLANSEDEWFKKLSLLVQNKELRHRIRLKGRATVEKYYSLKMYAPQMLKIIKTTMSKEKVNH